MKRTSYYNIPERSLMASSVVMKHHKKSSQHFMLVTKGIGIGVSEWKYAKMMFSEGYHIEQRL